MELNNPLEDLGNAFYSACYADMSDIEYEKPEPEAYKKWISEGARPLTVPPVPRKLLRDLPKVKATRRPTVRDLQVFAMFSQTWGSTALGFGGIGGAAMTDAYTVIIANIHDREFCVYFGGRFAYKVKRPTDEFFESVRSSNMRAVHKNIGAYGEVTTYEKS